MEFLRNLSIRKKILLIPILGAIGFFAYLLTSIELITTSNKRLEAARAVQFPLLQLASKNINRIEKIQEVLAYAVTSDERDGLDTANKLANDLREDFFSAARISTDSKIEIDNISRAFEDYYSVAYELSSGMINGSIDFSQVPQKSQQMSASLEALQTQLKQFYDESLLTFNYAFDKASRQSKNLFITGSSIGIGVSLTLILVGIVISNMIKNSIDQIILRLQNIANDNGDLTVRLQTRHTDEIGDLVKWFNTFMDKLQTVIQQIVETAPPLASLAGNVNHLSADITDTINRQNLTTMDTRNNIELMSHNVNTIAQNASEAASSAKIADEEAIKGQKIVSDTVSSIQKLSHNIREASTVITKLREDTDSVSVVLDVIKGIAEQTNLLALNAAIEAARAGEQGRGFAVVADEVRGLASRTQESTAEINSIIEQLQNASHAAEQTMEESTKAVEVSVSEANNAGNSLGKITETAAAIYSMNEHIAHATDEQQKISRELVDEADSIQQQMQKNAASASELRDVSSKLNSLASNLETITKQFKV